jgi:hypothetical protein
VAEALRQVAAEGWTAEARLSAESALVAMSQEDRQPAASMAGDASGHEHRAQDKHIMLSYQVRDKQCFVSQLLSNLIFPCS